MKITRAEQARLECLFLIVVLGKRFLKDGDVLLSEKLMLKLKKYLATRNN